MSVFGNQTKEAVLAEEILDTIKTFDWNPTVLTIDAIVALTKVLDHLTHDYNVYDEIE